MDTPVAPPGATPKPQSLGRRIRDRFTAAVVAPIQAFRIVYVPLLMVYFAYGALGLFAVADSFWVKQELSLTPQSLAQLGVWLTLPWAMKMVFGELVDTVAIAGSQRRVYVFLGASLIALGLILLAGAAGKWLAFAPPEQLYMAAQLVIVLGVVLQDVVADAMSTEVVPRVDEQGLPRPEADIERDLGFVQILGRLALSFGAFLVAGLGGYLAKVTSYETVFLISLVIPVISASGALLVKLEASETRPTDWRILGGGLMFGLTVTMLALLDVPYNQEIVLVISLAVVIAMLSRVTREIAPETRQKIVYAALIIFAFRATPSVGEGYRWFMIDELGFDEAFFGTLAQIGAGIALIAAWLLSDAITRKPVATVLLWLTIIGGMLAIPNLMLVYRADVPLSETIGVGAREIALIDAAAASPLAQLSMVPLLTLIAIYAPPSHRATWFALMASFMNLALVTGQLATKYLNSVFVVQRGMYGELPVLTVVVSVVGLAVPLAAIAVFGRNLKPRTGPPSGT